MLFRKTFRNALAALLGMALALATGSAHAQRINLDARGTATDPFNTAVYSLETLVDSTSRTVSVGTTKYYIVDAAGDRTLEAMHMIGVRNINERQFFLRYDLGNMVFSEAMSTATITAAPGNNQVGFADGTIAGNASVVYEGGGTVRDKFVLYRVTGTAGGTGHWDETSVVRARWQALAILPDSTGTVAYSAHVSLESALAGTNALVRKPAAGGIPAASAVRSVSNAVAPNVITASVASGFKQLSAASPNTPQRLGSITISVGPAQGRHLVADGAEAVDAIDDVMDTDPGKSTIMFEGDFRVGRFTTTNTTGATTCGAGSSALATVDATTKAVRPRVTIPAAMGATLLCITVAANNQDTIAEGRYMVSTNYSPITNAAFPPMEQADTMIGRIRYDGTTVQLPYLTTFSGYTQRVIIVNRNANSVGYNFTFTTEDGTSATRGDMATGSVPGMSTMVLKTTDLVTLTGKTRTSATLNVVATAGSVDVMTTQVNMGDQATDTVRYENVAN